MGQACPDPGLYSSRAASSLPWPLVGGGVECPRDPWSSGEEYRERLLYQVHSAWWSQQFEVSPGLSAATGVTLTLNENYLHLFLSGLGVHD